jgi:phospholipid/cholesterol/gamma-HCH transport system substrate-binding protein
MVFGKTSAELKVGVFVFIALVILAVFILSIGGLKTWSQGYKVNVVFNFVDGVKVGAPVRFAGVDVGRVKGINFLAYQKDNPAKVKIVCWIKGDVHMPADSAVWVNTLGLLGEKYVEIMPGRDFNNILAAGQTLVGVDPVPMFEVFRTTKGIIDNINVGVSRIMNKEGTLGKFLYDEALYNNLDALIIDIKNNPWKLFVKPKEKR